MTKIKLVMLLAACLFSHAIIKGDPSGAVPGHVESDRIYSYKDLTTQPCFKGNLEFPLMNRESKPPLSATIAIVVSKKGKITEAKLLESSDAEFGADALEIAKSGEWVLVPGKVDEESVQCVTVVKLWATFEFSHHQLKTDRRIWLADGMPSKEPAKKYDIRKNNVFKDIKVF